MSFKSTIEEQENERKEHLRKLPRCELKDEQLTEGVSLEHSTLFQARMRRVRQETRRSLEIVEEWRLLYEVIFPDESIPSPCKFNRMNSNIKVLMSSSVQVERSVMTMIEDNTASVPVEHLSTKIQSFTEALTEIFRKESDKLHGSKSTSQLFQNIDGPVKQLLQSFVTGYTYPSPPTSLTEDLAHGELGSGLENHMTCSHNGNLPESSSRRHIESEVSGLSTEFTPIDVAIEPFGSIASNQSIETNLTGSEESSGLNNEELAKSNSDGFTHLLLMQPETTVGYTSMFFDEYTGAQDLTNWDWQGNSQVH
jgi:hypothetical protein